jgi:hypothetical protein
MIEANHARRIATVITSALTSMSARLPWQNTWQREGGRRPQRSGGTQAGCKDPPFIMPITCHVQRCMGVAIDHAANRSRHRQLESRHAGW